MKPTPSEPERIIQAHGIRITTRNEGDRMIVQEVLGSHAYGAFFKPESRILDIGANIGCFSLLAASQGARVAAFEPDPENYRLLTRNLAINDCGANVRPFNMAVWSSIGEISLYDSCTDNFGGHSVVFARDRKRSTMVKCDTLEGAMAYAGFEEIDFLKMDCEGAEFEICYSPAMDRVKRMVMEVHPCMFDRGEFEKLKKHLKKIFSRVDMPWHDTTTYCHAEK